MVSQPVERSLKTWVEKTSECEANLVGSVQQASTFIELLTPIDTLQTDARHREGSSDVQRGAATMMGAAATTMRGMADNGCYQSPGRPDEIR